MGEFSQFALIPEQGVEPQKQQLDPEMQRRVETAAASLNIDDSVAVMAFGARIQKEMGTFTDLALKQMMQEDIKPLDNVMKSLAEQIRSVAFAPQTKGFFKKLFGGGDTSLKKLKGTYEELSPKIDRNANELTDRRIALMRDNALLERLYQKNEELYREVCSLLVIGEEVVRQGKIRGAKEESIARMDRRVQDLRITRVASTQLAAQIRLIQKNDELTCEKLRTTLEVTIPLWKAQMATALGLARANESARMRTEFDRTASSHMKEAARELDAQVATLKNSGASDQDIANQTARELLIELEEIEKSLEEQKRVRQADGV